MNQDNKTKLIALLTAAAVSAGLNIASSSLQKKGDVTWEFSAGERVPTADTLVNVEVQALSSLQALVAVVSYIEEQGAGLAIVPNFRFSSVFDNEQVNVLTFEVYL